MSDALTMDDENLVLKILNATPAHLLDDMLVDEVALCEFQDYCLEKKRTCLRANWARYRTGLFAPTPIDLVSEKEAEEKSNGHDPSLAFQESAPSPAFQESAHFEAENSESEQDPFGHVGSTLD